MELNPQQIALISRLAQGRKTGEADVLREGSILLWLSTLGATQNLGVDEFLGQGGLSYFLR